MKTFLILATLQCALASSATDEWTQLTVKYSGFGLVDRLLGKAFFPTGNTIDAANANDWKVVSNNNEFGLISLGYHGTDWRILALYTSDTRTLVGFQLSISQAEFDKNGPPTTNLMNAGTYEKKVVANIPTYSSTAYFVNPAVFAQGGPLTWTGLYIKNTTSSNTFTKVPDVIEDLTSQGLYTKQACIPLMGTHYYYKMDENSLCDNFDPFFLLYSNGKMTGVGWQQFLPPTYDSSSRNWWDFVNQLAAKLTVPRSPQCLIDYTNKYQVTSVHLYFTAQPWNNLLIC